MEKPQARSRAKSFRDAKRAGLLAGMGQLMAHWSWLPLSAAPTGQITHSWSVNYSL